MPHVKEHHAKKHHSKKSHKRGAVSAHDEELPRPGYQNAAEVAALGPHPRSHADVPRSRHADMGPQATGMPGSMSIIHNVQKPGSGIHGIPGIIHSTTLGPEVRGRLMDGIISSAMDGRRGAEGPVTKVAGVDATAYNAGMVHIRGSSFK